MFVVEKAHDRDHVALGEGKAPLIDISHLPERLRALSLKVTAVPTVARGPRGLRTCLKGNMPRVLPTLKAGARSASGSTSP